MQVSDNDLARSLFLHPSSEHYNLKTQTKFSFVRLALLPQGGSGLDRCFTHIVLAWGPVIWNLPLPEMFGAS